MRGAAARRANAAGGRAGRPERAPGWIRAQRAACGCSPSDSDFLAPWPAGCLRVSFDILARAALPRFPSGSARRRLQEARAVMKVESIAKAELHCHLEGCLRRETAVEVGRTLGIDVPRDPDVFRREWLITEPVRNLELALRKFANIQSIWCSEEVIERMTFEACEDACAQGLKILELRYSP